MTSLDKLEDVQVTQLQERVRELEQQLETAETCMHKSQERAKELEKVELDTSFALAKTEEELRAVNYFSAAAKDALEAVDKCIGSRSCLDDFAEGLTDAREMVSDVLSDTPPLIDLAAGREACRNAQDIISQENAFTGAEMAEILTSFWKHSQHFLDSMKVKP